MGGETREICNQVSVSTETFFVRPRGQSESLRARETDRPKAPADQASERTQTCVSEARRRATPARFEIAGAL